MVPFDAKRYYGMLAILMLIFCVVSHCMIVPIIFPFLNCMGWLTHALSILLSFGGSFLITETYQTEQNNSLLTQIRQSSEARNRFAKNFQIPKDLQSGSPDFPVSRTFTPFSDSLNEMPIPIQGSHALNSNSVEETSRPAHLSYSIG